MKIYFCLVLSLVVISGYSQTKDSLSLAIIPKNLSEYFSVIATKNDELVLFVYQVMDSALSEPILQKNLIITTSDKGKVFSCGQVPFKTDLLLFLIEFDSNNSIHQVDASLRVHHKKIVEAFLTKDYNTIEAYLGDEDILGYSDINTTNAPAIISVNGVQKADKYAYEIVLSLITNN